MSLLADDTALGSLRALVGGGPLLKDEIVILTGAAGGIGQAVALALAAAGARLGLVDVEKSDLRTLADHLRAEGALVVEREFDVTEKISFAAFREQVEEQLGPVSGLVNCAGLWRPLPYDELDEAGWEETIHANLLTAFVGCSAVLPGMVKRQRGSIVNFASTAGEYGSIRAAAHYAAAKGGVIALTKSLAREVGHANVRVNVVSPGPIDTPALLGTDQEKVQIGKRTLLERLGRPEEVACGCIFLLSPLSTFVTGQVLRVNGGALL